MTSGNPLLTLAVVLMAGAFAGELARRLRLPSVTGQILIGVLLGASVLGLVDQPSSESLHPVTHFALGLIAVQVGSHLQLRRLRNALRRLAWLLALEMLVTPLFVFAAVRWGAGESWQLALLLCAMAVSTAPATTIALIKESRAQGVFVKTLVAGVALNNIACIFLFELARFAARASPSAEGSGFTWASLTVPFQQLGAAAVLGSMVGVGLVLATRRVARRDRLATASMVAILLTSGLAQAGAVSSLLSCMFLGITLANLTPDKNETGHGVFVDFERAIYAIFFTLAGMELDFHVLASAGGTVVLVALARALGKLSAAHLAMRAAEATARLRRYLGMALVPQAGVAIGLVFLIEEDASFSEHFRQIVLAIGIAMVTINEVFGPILTRFALKRSGEYGCDRARLIDFLQEENIVTDLRAATKEEAIERLAEVLIQSNRLDADRAALVSSILEREKQVSTCVGSGLAIPHGVLPQGRRIVGAMGISREGMPFETPDGIPVHCMIVLATPASERLRHLEVLAAFARAIGTDPNVQLALFNARTPAHAYEVLHAEEAQGFNYFLDEPEIGSGAEQPAGAGGAH